MQHVSTTGTDHSVNRRLEDLALSALFSPEELAEVRLVAEERNTTAGTVIRQAVIDSLF